MQITVKYFASIREDLGIAHETVDSNASTLGALRDELLARGGGYGQALARDRAVRLALNQVMADDAAALTDGAEVAFFPPVTGG
jgi:sulfur-carrier protein